MRDEESRRRPWHLDGSEWRAFALSLMAGLTGNIIMATWVFICITPCLRRAHAGLPSGVHVSVGLR